MAKEVDQNALLDLFAKAAITKPARQAAEKPDPISKFLAKLNDQRIAFEKIDARGSYEAGKGDWVKAYDGGFSVKIGSSPLTISGKTSFKAQNKKEVLVLLDAAEKLILTNDVIRQQILDKVAQRSEKLKQARAKK